MLTLYHHIICPKSRLIRILLEEAEIAYELKTVEYWKKGDLLKKIDPIGQLPILKLGSEESATQEIQAFSWSSMPITTLYAQIEYILDLEPNFYFKPQSLEDRAAMRRLVYWIDRRFDKEVTQYVIQEKFLKLISYNKEGPNTEFIRAAKQNFVHHIDYFQSLAMQFGNISSNQLSVSDLFLAAHISILDYFGEINWDKFTWLKEWYAPIKSRPSLRKILAGRISMIKPPEYYEDPDF